MSWENIQDQIYNGPYPLKFDKSSTLPTPKWLKGTFEKKETHDKNKIVLASKSIESNYKEYERIDRITASKNERKTDVKNTPKKPADLRNVHHVQSKALANFHVGKDMFEKSVSANGLLTRGSVVVSDWKPITNPPGWQKQAFPSRFYIPLFFLTVLSQK